MDDQRFDPMDGFGEQEQLPPQNVELEQQILGAILVNNDVLLNVRDLLRDDMFYEPVHGRIYKACCQLFDKGERVDPVRLKPYFEHDEDLVTLEGAAYLVRLAGSVTTIINHWEYANGVRDLFIRRELLSVGHTIADDAQNMSIEVPAADLLERMEDHAARIHKEMSAGVRENTSIGSACDEALELIEKASACDGLVGVTTGIPELDELTGGAQEGQFIVIGGRPKMGKTLLALNAARAAGQAGHGVAMFSLEMSRAQLVSRMLTDIAAFQSGRSIPYVRALQGRLSADERELLVHASNYLSKLPIKIDDTSGLSVGQLRLKVKRFQREFARNGLKLGLVITDYLGLMRAGDRYKGSKVNEITEITRSLKVIARETTVPNIVLCQLNRGLENRDDKRPMLSDLRDSGSIEQDADVVMFVFRQAQYARKAMEGIHPSTPEYEVAAAELADLEGKMEIILAAQRQGPTGTVNLRVDLAAGAIRSKSFSHTSSNQEGLFDG